MKTLFCLLALVCSMTRMDAAIFKLDGDLTWEITEPRLTFKLDGNLQNLSPSNSSSGTIKLFLWATPAPYPSAGYIVGEYTLGPISGGYQFSDFTVRTTSKIPDISGTYHFTVVVSEYTGAGWRNVALARTGTKSLLSGDFTDQKKWSAPAAPVIVPPANLNVGNLFNLTLKATGEMNRFPVASQEKTTIRVRANNRVQVRNSVSDTRAPYSYEVRKRMFKGKKAPCGILSVNYPTGNENADATITLFFQTATSGTYKSTGAETTWGTFKFQ